MNFENVI